MESKESTELAPLKKRTIAVQNRQEAVHRLRASLEDIVTIKSDWLDQTKAELDRAIAANQAVSSLEASDSKKRYLRNRVAMLRKTVNILEAGFIPIPRFSASTLNIELEQFPVKALVALSDAKATELFDEIRVVKGQEAERGYGWRQRVPQRDPLLVGIVKMPAEEVRVTQGGYIHTRRYPARENHFLLSWWTESDEIDSDMF